MKNLDTKLISYEGLTFDDVLVLPAYSSALPSEALTETRLASGFPIHIPILSAAMDTVTESSMAIAMALSGGMGLIHKNMSIEAQVQEVQKVKRSQSGMIIDPIVLAEDALAGDAMQVMHAQKIGGIPIVNTSRKLVGIITNRDLRFHTNKHTPIAKLMTPMPLITLSDKDDLLGAENLLRTKKIEKLPIIDTKGLLRGLITYKDILKNKDKPYASKDKYGRLRCAGAIGIAQDTMLRVQELVKANVDLLCIDTAHAHSNAVIKLTRALKKTLNVPLMVGNLATADATKDLIKAGADILKVGVGPGSICTTRVIAGIGVPQLTAIMHTAAAAKHANIPIVADGGIRFSGDIVKAIAAGADAVMVGSLLAGTEEAPGNTILLQGKKYKTYRGMGSIEAMQQGAKDRYFQEQTQNHKLVPEGIVGRVPYRGPTHEVLTQLVGGLRAGMGYAGAKDLKQLKNAQIIKITNASIQEGHPHDVTITQEAPNYS